MINNIIFNEKYEQWECNIKIGSNDIDISIENDFEKNEELILKNIIPIINMVINNLDHIKEETAKSLIDLKNEIWLDEDLGEEKVSVEEFKKLINLETIEISLEQLSFWFDDGDLFWGHVIVSDFDLEGKFIDAGIHG